MTPSLIPNLKKYVDNELNVMVISWHGVGKTYTFMDFAEENNMRMAYLSAATMDPYTDFVGIPTPRRHCEGCGEYWPVDMRICPNDDVRHPGERRLGPETLVNVRPHHIDQAQLLVIDEFNRGDRKTQNACMELVQFRSINGEKFPHLKCVCACMNPPDTGQYAVEEIDPAMVDRFDIYITLDPTPSYHYLISRGISDQIAKAAIHWYIEQDQTTRDPKNYISPRRLEKICIQQELLGTFEHAIPSWQDVERNKLKESFDLATQIRNGNLFGGKLGEGAYRAFHPYTENNLSKKSQEIIRYLYDHPDDIDTSKAIAQAIKTKQSATLAQYPWIDMINAFNKPVLEGFIGDMGVGKREKFAEIVNKSQAVFATYDNITAMLNELETEF